MPRAGIPGERGIGKSSLLHITGLTAKRRETLQWYAKKGAAKIGVKWD
jgi:ABC-type lipoprotein export system ATPase subunit